MLDRISRELYESSRSKQLATMTDVDGTVGDVLEVVESGKMAVAGWSGMSSDEQRLKDETGMTIRIYPEDYDDRQDPITGRVGRAAIFARAY